jgi:uncharacterized membrane protein YfhO
MNKGLYQINKEYLQLIDAIMEAEGEVSEEQSLQLAITEKELETKGICYAYIVKGIESDNDAIDAELKRLKALKDRNNKTIEKLENNVQDAMNLFGITEIKSATLKINFRKSESIEISQEALIPKEYMTEKITYTPNKQLIKEAIKNGLNVQGASLVTNQNLQIK